MTRTSKSLLLDALCANDKRLAKAADFGRRLRAAEEAVQAAHAELDAFLEAGMASVLGPEKYRAEVEKRQEDIRQAQTEWSEVMRANLAIGVAGTAVRTPEQLVAAWPTMTMNERRAVVRAYIAAVKVTKADPKRRKHQPIRERVQVIWNA